MLISARDLTKKNKKKPFRWAPNLFDCLEKNSLRFPEMCKVYIFSRLSLGIRGRREIEQQNARLAGCMSCLKQVSLLSYYWVMGRLDALAKYFKQSFGKKLLAKGLQFKLKKKYDCTRQKGPVNTWSFQHIGSAFAKVSSGLLRMDIFPGKPLGFSEQRVKNELKKVSTEEETTVQEASQLKPFQFLAGMSHFALGSSRPVSPGNREIRPLYTLFRAVDKREALKKVHNKEQSKVHSGVFRQRESCLFAPEGHLL